MDFPLNEDLKKQLQYLIRASYELSKDHFLVHKEVSLEKELYLLEFLNRCPLPAMAFFLVNHRSQNPYCPCCRARDHRQFNEDFMPSFYDHPFFYRLRIDKKRALQLFLQELILLSTEEEFKDQVNSYDFFVAAFDRMINPLKYKLRKVFYKENTLDCEIFCLCGMVDSENQIFPSEKKQVALEKR